MNRFGYLAILAGWTLLAGPAQAGIHTWDVSEVFTNADGSIQYVELLDTGAGGTETGVGNGTISSNTQSHTWANGPVTPPTNGRFYLIASAGFAALPGAPTPDVILPAGKVPFFTAAADAVAFGGFDTCNVTNVPTDGINAYNCISASNAVNSPSNYAGQTGSVNAAPALPVPTMSPAVLLGMVGLLLGAAGLVVLRRRRLTA